MHCALMWQAPNQRLNLNILAICESIHILGHLGMQAGRNLDAVGDEFYKCIDENVIDSEKYIHGKFWTQLWFESNPYYLDAQPLKALAIAEDHQYCI